ncbi:MAG: hypothetical protein IRZ10_11265 [Thermoflavifilum sp.]|nr:hypothetical protein [Thermoflavifilum sp.]MCL6514982.1 hypothetical protein [Alicyclobacillus sp.]
MIICVSLRLRRPRRHRSIPWSTFWATSAGGPDAGRTATGLRGTVAHRVPPTNEPPLIPARVALWLPWWPIAPQLAEFMLLCIASVLAAEE